MRLLFKILPIFLVCSCPAFAQQKGVIKAFSPIPQSAPSPGDVFNPISKYMAQGNAEALSAWFADNLEVTVLSRGGDASKAQAKQILKSFFDNYTPRSFEITHTAGRANMKYALGELKAGGETFQVTIFVSCQDETYKIQQLIIERL